MEGHGTKWHRTGVSGPIFTGSAVPLIAIPDRCVQPTVLFQTATMCAPVDVLLDDKGTSHGIVAFVMAHYNRAVVRASPVLCVYVEDHSVGRETLLDILASVTIYDCSLAIISRVICSRIPLSSLDGRLKAKG